MRIDRRLNTCKHFNGMQNEKCEAGVHIRKLVGGDDFGWRRRMPCTPPFREGDPPPVPCEKFCGKTLADLKREDDEFERAIALIDGGASPCCKAALNDSAVVNGLGARHCSECGGFVDRRCGGMDLP